MKKLALVCILMGLLGFSLTACNSENSSIQESSSSGEDIKTFEVDTQDQDDFNHNDSQSDETSSDNQVMQYVQEHMEYALSEQYDADISPYFTGYMEELVNDIESNSGVEGYDILSAYDTLFSFDFSQLDEEEEYELLLAQIFFNSQGEQTIRENYAEGFTRTLINIASLLVDSKDYKDVLSEDNRQSLTQVINSISSCDPGSAAWDQNVNGLFNLLDGYDNLDIRRSIAGNLTSQTWVMCAIDTTLDEIDLTQRTLSEIVMYTAVCEASYESNLMFSDLILDMRQHIAIKSDDSKFDPILNSQYLVSETSIQQLLNMNQIEYADPLLNAVQLDVLADALERFYSVLVENRDGEATTLADYALETMVDGTGFNLTYNASNAVISLFSALPVIREYKALRALVSTGKLMVELYTTVEDQSYNAKMVQRLRCMLLIESKSVESIASGAWDVVPINFEGSLDDYQFQRAGCLDMAVNVYKSILSCAAQYGSKYAQYRLAGAWSNNGKQWPSTLITMMTAEQVVIDKIQCHQSNFDYDTLWSADNVSETSEIDDPLAESESEKEYTEEDLRSLLASATSDDIVSWIYDDFDGDSTYEAYALTYPSDEANVWFVSSNGAELIMNAGNAGWYSDTSLVAGNHKFMVLIQYEPVPTMYYAKHYLFTVKDGESYQPTISGDDGYFGHNAQEDYNQLAEDQSGYETPVTDAFYSCTWRAYGADPAGRVPWENIVYYDFDESSLEFVARAEKAASEIASSTNGYRQIIQKAISEESSLGLVGTGMVYDIDGNGVDELVLVYDVEISRDGAVIPYRVCSLYTMDGDTVVPLLEKHKMGTLAGATPNEFVGSVSKDGNTYFGIYFDKIVGEDMDILWLEGSWYLFSISGTEISKASWAEYALTLNYSENQIIPEESSAIIDGEDKTYMDYEVWNSTIGNIAVISNFDDDYNPDIMGTLEELLDKLS